MFRDYIESLNEKFELTLTVDEFEDYLSSTLSGDYKIDDFRDKRVVRAQIHARGIPMFEPKTTRQNV